MSICVRCEKQSGSLVELKSQGKYLRCPICGWKYEPPKKAPSYTELHNRVKSLEFFLDEFIRKQGSEADYLRWAQELMNGAITEPPRI